MDLTVPTCWKYWLKLKDKYCPYLNDLSHLAPRIVFLAVLGHAGHSIVLKVQIEDKTYALKLFFFLRPVWNRKRFGWYAVTADPFFVECQVYDQFIEAGLNGKIGPVCHGWLKISESQEAELNGMLQVDWHRREDTLLEPVHGLLLDYIDGCDLNKATPPLDAQNLRDQLAKLHSLDIIHADFKASNIMVSKDGEGHIIDFSASNLWPNVRESREGFDEWQKVEVQYLEYFFFRLQNLKCFQGVELTPATTAEQAYGGAVDRYAQGKFA
ncbi:hypothetical protein FQN50_001010 [Emmonsiellopsis sp. PD_5]|nr:hypothetical protein FQN50_001010 [Emmonsiellopsis sp. PD_5]